MRKPDEGEDALDLGGVIQRLKYNIIKRKKSEGSDHSRPHDLIGDLNYIESNWDLEDSNYEIKSHRPIVGQVLVKGRSAVHGEVRRYVDPAFTKQSIINSSLLHAMKEICRRHDALALRLDALESAIASQNSYTKSYPESEGAARATPGSCEDSIYGMITPYFQGCSKVIVVGCGKGDFLESLKKSGVAATGVDLDEEAVRSCTFKGFKTSQGDPVEQMGCLDDGSLDGIFLGKSLENFEADYLGRLVGQSHRKLAPGRYIVAEVLDPVSAACQAGQPCQGMDSKTTGRIDRLSAALEAEGFTGVEIKFFPQPSERWSLEKLEPYDGISPGELKVIKAYNANIDRLNCIMFGLQGFAVVARR